MRSDPRQLVSLAQDGKGSSGWIVPRRAAGQGALQNRPGQGVTGAAGHSPHVGIGGTAPNNTAAFTRLADTDEASRAMLDGAVALAQTAVDAATDPDLNANLMKRVAARS